MCVRWTVLPAVAALAACHLVFPHQAVPGADTQPTPDGRRRDAPFTLDLRAEKGERDASPREASPRDAKPEISMLADLKKGTDAKPALDTKPNADTKPISDTKPKADAKPSDLANVDSIPTICLNYRDGYKATIPIAKTCNVDADCSAPVYSALDCPCPTYVNPSVTSVYSMLLSYASLWKSQGCDKLAWNCPKAPCFAPAVACIAGRCDGP